MFHRKNLDIRVRNVERSFGNKVTWDTPFENHFERFVSEANNLVFDSGKQCKAINQNVLDLDEHEYDLVYLDPPYFRKDGTNETADYLKCYHFLEGIARYSEWPLHSHCKYEFTYDKLGKENVDEVLEQLLSKFRRSKIVISYKIGGVPSIDKLIKLLGKFKRTVYSKSIHYKYALNRQNGDARLNREYLVVGS